MARPATPPRLSRRRAWCGALVALVAATFFVGNQELSRRFLKEHGYIPAMLSKSRLNRLAAS